MSQQTWQELVSTLIADGAAVANTTSETILFPDVTIPANLMETKKALRITCNGKYSNTGTPTMQFTVRWGGVAGVVLCKTFAITTPSGVTNVPFELEIMINCRSGGATGTFMANGKAIVFAGVAPTVGSATGAPGISAFANGTGLTPAVATVDMTIDKALSVTLIWSAASASNTATGLQYELDLKN